MNNCVGTTGITDVCRVRFYLKPNSIPHTCSERTQAFQSKLTACFGISFTQTAKTSTHMDQDFPVLGTVISYALNQFFEICTCMLFQKRLEFNFVYISLHCPIFYLFRYLLSRGGACRRRA